MLSHSEVEPGFDGLVAKAIQQLQSDNNLSVELFLSAHCDESLYSARLKEIWPSLKMLAAIENFNAVTESVPTLSESTESIWESRFSKSSGNKIKESSRLACGEMVATYRIDGFLGQGGMGAVYRAFDTVRKIPVVLKTVPFLTPQSLYQFKNEFRNLAGVTHPNLVNLFELINDGPGWFIVMEFIDGVDFREHCRGQNSIWAKSNGQDYSQIEEAIGQLALGVAGLHRSHRLHRDLKPSNVMVCNSGRVVILDFGLAAQLQSDLRTDLSTVTPAGTMIYMAPEQAMREPLTVAADWYSFGTIIYEVLTGQVPFYGISSAEVLRKKLLTDVPKINEQLRCPIHLVDLCLDLMTVKSELRPAPNQIFDRLLAGNESNPVPIASILPEQETLFVGRDTEMNQLCDAFHRTTQGPIVSLVHIHGRSGVGKSVLIDRFVTSLKGTTVLRGRCFEHETVPFKALDTVADALAEVLGNSKDLQAILSADISELATVFPSLQRLRSVSNVSLEPVDSMDPYERRQRAFRAFRRILETISQSTNLVIILDDLQWGDRDSVKLLQEILRPPHSFPMMLIASYRSEESTSSPFLVEFLTSPTFGHLGLNAVQIALEPLTPEATEFLTRQLMAHSEDVSPLLLETISRESCGNPYFVTALVQRARERSGDVTSHGSQTLTLESVLWDRIMELPEQARKLLEIASIHGRPLKQMDAWRAAGLENDERPIVALLRSSRMIRSMSVQSSDVVETFHDRIRETVVAKLGEDQKKTLHRSLAAVLQNSPDTEPEILASHFHAAGDLEIASTYYTQAAKQASDALAFYNASKLYRLALETGDFAPSSRIEIQTRLGESLANAGRGAESANVFLEASEHASSNASIDLKRQAAQQFLTSGLVVRGLDQLGTVLDSVGMKLAGSQRRAFASLIFHRLWLSVRGLQFKPRSASLISPQIINRIDIGWAASLGMSMNDNTRAADIQTRHLLLALRAGEPMRITRALAMEVPHMAGHTGLRMKQKAAALSHRAEELAREQNSDYLLALVLGTRGVAVYLNERWAEAIDVLEQSEQLFRQRCCGVAWEMATVRTFQMWSLQQMGDLSELATRCPAHMQEAQERGDLYAVTNLRCFASLVQLKEDRLPQAIQELDIANQEWSHESYHIQHYAFFQARVNALLYANQAEEAWQYALQGGSQFNKSFLSRIQLFRIHVLQLTAYAGVALLHRTPVSDQKQRERLLVAIAGYAKKLKRENTPWASATAVYIQAVIAKSLGNSIKNSELLHEAILRFDEVDLKLFANSIRCGLSETAFGSAADQRKRGQEYLECQSIAARHKLMNIYAPGSQQL